MTRYPQNAEPLVAMRQRGEKPESPVLVSLVGKLEFPNLTLIARPSQAYDWRPLVGLDVEVFASHAVPFGELLRALADIAAVVPASMVLTFPRQARVHCGDWTQVSDFRLFDWFPIGVDLVRYPGGGKLASLLWAELGKSLPIPYVAATHAFLAVAQEAQKCA
ncbi:histidine ammonia-lyase [Pararobbsia silviterrae]|uniref:Histidine ammonia-lyase n=1 Tax=Pararobbsia silviterrae TaxID=1792498 RepID=A0A494Y6Z4_9BURK|nr:histidine ammonia-lyase [Pararobbsia silviterrae]RKP56381.1 histidine ammonia-lyase [Pararobbsia silviterrae]